MEKSDLCKEFVLLQVNKNITKLFKTQLDNLEDIKLENETIISKVSDKTSLEYAASINSLDKKKLEQMRKRVLDAGNDSIREIQSVLSVFTYVVDEEKLDQYIKSKKIIKRKFCSGGIIEEEEEQG